MNSGKLLHMLMGNGAGELIQSAFNANIILTNNSTELYTLKQYGVGYGFASGYLMTSCSGWLYRYILICIFLCCNLISASFKK